MRHSQYLYFSDSGYYFNKTNTYSVCWDFVELLLGLKDQLLPRKILLTHCSEKLEGGFRAWLLQSPFDGYDLELEDFECEIFQLNENQQRFLYGAFRGSPFWVKVAAVDSKIKETSYV